MIKFGYGRDLVKKLHVDEILYKGLSKEADANPGPGSHNISKEWTIPDNGSLSKTTP